MTQNPNRAKKCSGCGLLRPAASKYTPPKHRAALELPYEWYVERFGERCGICGFVPQPGGRKLDRDHEHVGEGRPRGLLCAICNKKLDDRVSPEWLRNAADYLEICYSREDVSPD